MLPSPPPSPTLSCTPSSSCHDARLGQTVGGHIQLTELLGVGAYGTVYKAVDMRTGMPFAVKALSKVGLEARQRMFQQREVSLHSAVSAHPNIVAMTDIFEDDECMFCVMEFCPEGDLFTRITDDECYIGNDFLIRDIFVQILNAVEYCHSLGVFHRDLKPENVLVCNNGRTVKLADFGLATREFYNSDFGCGSTFYMSPECQQTDPLPYACYNSAANDVWSLGVMLVNLTCGRNPWKRASAEDPTYRAYSKDRGVLKSILPISDELDLILRNVFEPNPSYRFTVSQFKFAVLNCSTFSKPTSCAPSSPVSSPYTPIEAPLAWQPQPQPQQHYQQELQTMQTPEYSALLPPQTPQMELDYQEIALAQQLAQLSTSNNHLSTSNNHLLTSNNHLSTSNNCSRESLAPPLSGKRLHTPANKLPVSCASHSLVTSALMPFYNNLTNFTKHGLSPRFGLA